MVSFRYLNILVLNLSPWSMPRLPIHSNAKICYFLSHINRLYCIIVPLSYPYSNRGRKVAKTPFSFSRAEKNIRRLVNYLQEWRIYIYIHYIHILHISPQSGLSSFPRGLFIISPVSNLSLVGGRDGQEWDIGKRGRKWTISRDWGGDVDGKRIIRRPILDSF